MRKVRLKGDVGDEDMTVMTEWIDRPADGEMTGIEMGLKIRGWRNIRREEKDERSD